jgi:hypothetical protein
MIINLWSTPRTGSVWYSIYLRSQYPNSILLSELFNQNLMSIYHTSNGHRLNHVNYSKGCYYNEYYINNGNILIKPIFGQRKRTVDEEELHRIELFEQINLDKTYILHNHVSPINKKVLEQLVQKADKNIYIYRKDKRAQLASYAVAFSTKKFAQFSGKADIGTVEDIDESHLVNLINRIKIWDQLPKQDIIAYEDIDFIDNEGWPIKQTPDYKSRLSNNMISLIDKLVSEYENKVL